MRVFTLDNTFGYNPGRAGLAFSLADKLAAVERLDHLGIDYIEAGCPGVGNGLKFFSYAREFPLGHARLAVSLRLDAVREVAANDGEIAGILEAATPVAVVSACSWRQPGAGEDHRQKIAAVVGFLKARGLEVIFRDEDFFQAYLANSAAAIQPLEAAKTAGADLLCLRDSAGAGVPQLVREICAEVRKRFEGTLGICAHDDSELALANTLEAVEQGFTHVEGSINAYGSRHGLANLSAIISSLERKLGHTAIGPEKLDEMNEAARALAEAESAALERRAHGSLGVVPKSADALLESLDPHLMAGIPERRRRALVEQVQMMQEAGYDLRKANGTFELLARDARHPDIRPFTPERYELTSHSGLSGGVSTATATIRVGDHIRSETEDGDGTVNALERALRQCLFAVYPETANVRLIDYQVQPLEPSEGTMSRGRVTIEWTDGARHWITSGVAKDIVEATWRALVDGFRLPLMRIGERASPVAKADSSWAV